MKESGGSKGAEEAASSQDRQEHDPIPGERALGVEAAGENLKKVHQVADGKDTSSKKWYRDRRFQGDEKRGNQHAGKNDALLDLQEVPQARPHDLFPVNGGGRQNIPRDERSR